jgi:superfamily II DNA/RNA helicase
MDPTQFEAALFPEFKFLNHLTKHLHVLKNKESEHTHYICIKSADCKNTKSPESLWVSLAQKALLQTIVDEIATRREKKSTKKLDTQDEGFRKKERRFNKLYDQNNFPRDVRKQAYAYFVRDSQSYLKNITLDKIKKFIKRPNKPEFSLLLKQVKGAAQKLATQHEDFSAGDFHLVCFRPIRVSTLKANIQVQYNVMSYKDIIKACNNYLPSDDKLLALVHEHQPQAHKRASDKLDTTIAHIKSRLTLDNIDRDICLNAVSKIAGCYNDKDAYDQFLFQAFQLYSRRSPVFSRKQNEVFGYRQKFRNRVQFIHEGREYNSCAYLSFQDVRQPFIDIAREKAIDLETFNLFFLAINQVHIEKKTAHAKLRLTQAVMRTSEALLQHPDGQKSGVTIGDLSTGIGERYHHFCNLAPENRRREITAQRLLEIESGQQQDFHDIVRKILLNKYIAIDYKTVYTKARKLKRHFTFLIGKTNSGKTYQAFNTMCNYQSGAYLSPLRLLALEGQGEIERRGHACSMLTGEEKHIDPDAQFTSSTIEMIKLREEVDCIVIDEIQMLKDPQRGWAWTQAVVGAPAKNVILTGSEEVLPLVEALIEYTGDTLSIERLERKSPLKINSDINSLKNIKSGTAIIAFSRRDVLSLKGTLKDRKVSVIYGNLGPKVRITEAEKFRNGETDILIATDAIAMGLNLPIEQVLFYSHTKHINGKHYDLDAQLVHQIAGRAGRYGLKNVGYAGALSNKTLKYVRGILREEIPIYQGKAYIKPTLDYIEKIKVTLNIDDFHTALEAFEDLYLFQNPLFECTDLGKVIEMAEEVSDLSLSDEERLILASAPVRENTEYGIELFRRYAKIWVDNKDKRLQHKNTISGIPIGKYANMGKTQDNQILKKAEEAVHALDLYTWFNNLDEDVFSNTKGAEEQKDILSGFILNSLTAIST